MDSLTFGTNYLLRGFNSKKEPIIQIELKEMLEGFQMDMEQFVDLCIMCGCDYTTNIPGIGPVKAFKYIEACKNIESVLEKIDRENDDPKKKSKYTIPETFYFKEARKLFHEPDGISDKATLEAQIKWNKPDEETLKEYLVNQKGFAENKVESGLKRLKAT